MIKTISISLPEQQLSAIQTSVDRGLFASISEAVRDAVRKNFMANQLTVNGFTPQVENKIVEVINSIDAKDIVEFPQDMSIENQLTALSDIAL